MGTGVMCQQKPTQYIGKAGAEKVKNSMMLIALLGATIYEEGWVVQNM